MCSISKEELFDETDLSTEKQETQKSSWFFSKNERQRRAQCA